MESETKVEKVKGKSLNLKVDPITLKKLKIIAVLKDTDLKGLLREAVDKILEENKDRIAGLKLE